MSSALSSMSRFLIAEFALTKAQFGALATAFTLGSALTAPIAGRLTDRVGGRRLLAMHFLACSVGSIGAALSISYVWLLVAVAAFGLVSSSSNPAANRLIAIAAPLGERGRMMGVKATGHPLMVTAAGVMLPSAAGAWGWRAAMMTGLAICAAGLLLVLRVPPDRPIRRHGASPPLRVHLPISIKWLTMNAFAMGAGTAAVLAFLPLFAQDQVGMSVSRSGLLLALVGITSVVGRLIWGRRSNRATHVSVALNWLSGISIGATVALGLAPLVGEWLAWLAAGFAGVSMAAWNAVGMTAIVEEVDTSVAGVTSGIVMSGFLAGWMITPPVFGLVVDSTGSYSLAWTLVSTVFALALLPTMFWRRAWVASRA
jgi:predicted MFS family arabinose efflux permease